MKVRKDTPYCSSCFGQYIDRKYIDLEAAWDGPILSENNGMKYPIDDLNLCEVCLSVAAKELGMDFAKDLKSENFELGQLNEKLQIESADKDKMITDLIHTVDSLRKTPIKSPGGRPTLMTPEKIKEAVGSLN